jgi:hypothetical protein
MAVAAPTSESVTRALRGGVATLDAVAARIGGERELLLWALGEAVERGWVSSSDPGCGPDGLCATNAPVVYSITESGRAATRA